MEEENTFNAEKKTFVGDQLLIWEVASELQYNHVMSKPGHLQQIPQTFQCEQTMEEKNIGCWTKRHSLSIMAQNDQELYYQG